ncbi:MAG: DUF4160 domain-containing protein [Candidatus Acidiferrales bacterium]
MPTVLRAGPYRFHFYSHEPNEPPHIHAERDDCAAKFWLEPISLAVNYGFASHELGRIQSIIEGNLQALLEEWNGYFGLGGR